MAYLIQYKQKKQVLNTLLVLALVISNLVMPYDNPALAQSSLRQRATLQAKGPRSDLEASLIEPEKSTPITPQTPSTAEASSAAEQIKEFIIKLRTTQKDIYKDRNQLPFKGTFKKKINLAQNLYLVGWREGKKVHQVVAYLPFIPPQTEVTLSCHFLEEPPKGIEKQWVLMIDTPKDTAFRLFTGKGAYLAPIKLPLASRKGGLALAKIAPEQDVTTFAKLGNFTDPRNPPCSQDRFSITPYTYGVVYLSSWKETDEQGKHKIHHLRMSISSNHLEKDKNGKFLPLYIEPVYIKGIPKELGGSQWILIAKTLTGNRYYRFKKEGKYHLIQVNNRNIPLGFRMADETIVERITPQVALKSSSAGKVDEQGKARNIEEGRELTKLIGMAMLPNYLRLLLIEQDQQIPLTAPMVRIKLPAWMMQDERIANPLVRKIVDLVKELLAELRARKLVFEETLQDVNIMASEVELQDMGDNLAERFYSALSEGHNPAENTELSERIARNTGRLLATLHNNGIIADDTHCYQFIANKKGEIRRIDLPHVYIFNPKVANHLMRSRDEGGYGFTEAELKSMNIYPHAIPDESVLAEINSLLLHPNVLLHPLFVIPFAKTYLEYARDISPKVGKYVERVWIKNAEQALENWEGRKDKERPEEGSKASSAGAVMELPRVDVGPYMERVDCVRSYLDRLSKGLEREENLLDEISKTQGAEGLIADTTAGVRKARVRLKQAEINIKRLSRAMKEQNLPSLINALRKIPNGAEERLSRLQTPAFLFVKEIAKLSKETARPHPVIDFNPWAVLFIPQKSWLSDMFGFHSAGKIVEISDGENSSEILLIKAEEKSLVEIIKSILHESIHRRFTRGRRIIEETQPELLPFYHILEEAAAESLTMEVFEYLKRTELGHYLLEEIPKKGIYDYISTEEYYLYEREFSKVLKKNLGERIGEYLEEFLTKGDPQLLRDALGEQAEEFIEKLLRGDNTKPLKKVLENQARRCIDEFLINANPEPLKKILGPLWERLTSITERINIFNNVDVSKQDLVYDTAVRMIFLFLPHPDAAAKMDAGILLLDALEEMDLEDIAEIEFKLFLEFGPESFNQCIDRAVLRVIKEILKAEGIDLKTAKSDFQHKLYQYTIEEAQRCLPAIELPHSQENIKASSSGTHSLPVKVSPAEETMEELSKGVSILDITDTNQMKDIMKSLLPGALFKKYGPGKIELSSPESPILSKGAEGLPAYAWAIHFESKKGRVLLALSDNRNEKGNALAIERLVLTENNKPGMAPEVIMGIFSSLGNFGRQAGYSQLRCEVSLTNSSIGGHRLIRLYEIAGFHPDEQSRHTVELIEEAAKAKTDIKDLAGLDRFVTELAILKGVNDIVGLEKDLKTAQTPTAFPTSWASSPRPYQVKKINELEKAISQAA